MFGENARRGAKPARSKTSPNSSSMSRRMRSKLAKGSRSGAIGAKPIEGSNEVNSALTRQLDGPSEGVRGLVAGPQRVELVGDVRDHHSLRRGRAGISGPGQGSTGTGCGRGAQVSA